MTADDVRKKMSSIFKFRMFLIAKLPAAWIAGLRLVNLNEETAEVSIKYKYFNKNPFKSIYFASMSMAAELSTGVLAFVLVLSAKQKISMLVTKLETDFHKKAVGKIIFKCEDGLAIKQCIDESLATGEGRTIRAKSLGYDEQGDLVATFYLTWSFKAKSKK